MWKDKAMEATMFMPLKRNRITDTDSYKSSHPFQYHEDLTYLRAYLTSRGGRYSSVLWFGLQAILLENLIEPFTRREVEEAATFFAKHGEPFPLAGWMRVIEVHGGKLPLRIRALPEGSLVPCGVPLMVVESTDPKLMWLVSWFETMLMRVWYPTTVATLSHACKRVIFEALVESSDDPVSELPFKLHDFGSRGVSSRESAGMGGMAHLVNFQGSDTVEGVRYANHFYNCDMAGFSIPAAEHSTMVIEGELGQINCARRLLQAFGRPGAVFSMVADGFDVYDMVENICCGDLLEEIRASGAKLVVRPDSGVPDAVNVALLDIFERKGLMHKNFKGYKVLEKCFGLIQGDGNKNEDDIRVILNALHRRKFSASNIAFGMGGGLLQMVNRDTQRFKYMVSLARYKDGREVEVAKNPRTDSAKRSVAGCVDTVLRDGQFKLVGGNPADSMLQRVYEDGVMYRFQTLEEVRKIASKGFV